MSEKVAYLDRSSAWKLDYTELLVRLKRAKTSEVLVIVPREVL